MKLNWLAVSALFNAHTYTSLPGSTVPPSFAFDVLSIPLQNNTASNLLYSPTDSSFSDAMKSYSSITVNLAEYSPPTPQTGLFGLVVSVKNPCNLELFSLDSRLIFKLTPIIAFASIDDSCSTDHKIKNLEDFFSKSQLTLASVVFYFTDNATANRNTNKIPMYYLESNPITNSLILMANDLSSYNMNNQSVNYMKMSVFPETQSTGIWEFILVIVVILLAVSFFTSILMHCHLYRIRRINARLRETNATYAESINSEHGIDVGILDRLVPTSIFHKKKVKKGIPKKEMEVVVTPNTEKDRPISIASLSNSIEENTLCAICLDNFEEGNEIRQLQCAHSFHSDCIDPWLTEKSKYCPYCKSEVLYNKESGEVEKRASIEVV